MDYTIEKNVLRYLKKLKRSDLGLYRKVLQKIEIFQNNENHPSLRIHKLHGDLEGYWSISVDRSLRIIYYIENNKACFINIGTHDEVYRVN